MISHADNKKALYPKIQGQHIYRGTTLLYAFLVKNTFQALTSLSDITVAPVAPTDRFSAQLAE